MAGTAGAVATAPRDAAELSTTWAASSSVILPCRGIPRQGAPAPLAGLAEMAPPQASPGAAVRVPGLSAQQSITRVLQRFSTALLSPIPPPAAPVPPMAHLTAASRAATATTAPVASGALLPTWIRWPPPTALSTATKPSAAPEATAGTAPPKPATVGMGGSLWRGDLQCRRPVARQLHSRPELRHGRHKRHRRVRPFLRLKRRPRSNAWRWGLHRFIRRGQHQELDHQFEQRGGKRFGCFH